VEEYIGGLVFIYAATMPQDVIQVTRELGVEIYWIRYWPRFARELEEKGFRYARCP
jgi:hypothetical protein